LRFVAALYVFLFHIQIRWPLVAYPFFKNILEQGAVGMSLFFMLSGFVLTHRYSKGQSTYKAYIVNRFARIYPIYLVAAILTLPWIGISFGTGSIVDIASGLGRSTLLIFANVFLIQAWFPQFFSYWNDGGSWSISVEAFCYVMLPLALPYLSRLSLKQSFILACLFLLLAVLPGLSDVLFKSALSNIYYSMPIFRLPEFLIGTLICFAVKGGVGEKLGAKLQAIVILVYVTYLGFFGPSMPYVAHDWMTLPVVAFMILSLSNGKGLIAALLASRAFVWLGKISYCFYSFQVAIIILLVNYHDKLVHRIPLLSHNKVLAIVAFITLIVISALGYYLVEEPSRRWIRRRYHAPNPLVVSHFTENCYSLQSEAVVL